MTEIQELYQMIDIIACRKVPSIPLGKSLNNANSMGSNLLQLQGPGVPYNVPQQNQLDKAPQILSEASEGNDKIGSIGITGNPSQYLVDRSVIWYIKC